MSFVPIKRSAVPEEIAARLLDLIRERQLRPGDKLPPERDLAATMQVSRPSLREALAALAMMNVIETRQGDGTYVTSLDPDLLVEPLDFALSLDDTLILHLFEVRRILEVAIARLAAERITPDQAAVLAELVDLAPSVEPDAEAFLALDLRLHSLIAEAAGNPLLRRIMASLGRLGLASRTRTGASAWVRATSVGDHRAIVAALQAHDPQAAAEAMLIHLDHVESTLRSNVPTFERSNV